MTSREYWYHKRKKQRWLDWDIPDRRNPNARICEDESCSHFATVECRLDYFNEETDEWEEQIEWLCTEHAEENGYCMGCGTFIAGTGMEFTNNGYCDNCWDEIRSQWEEENDDFDEDYFDDYSY